MLSEQIYSPKVRVYFKEVLSTYSAGNYRSAVVMLYTTCLCDLVEKLFELRDFYDDKVAGSIIKLIESEQSTSNSKSSWEKSLVDNVAARTHLLNPDARTYLQHIFDTRNLCAHPALNRDGELMSPRQEIVSGYIRVMLEELLTKPPIFTNRIVDYMSDDLADLRDILHHNNESVKRYINNKYLSRMTDAVYQKTFRSFWKFTFNSQNEDCKNNRNINFFLLKCMFDERPEIVRKEIVDNQDKYNIGKSDQELGFAVVYLGYCPILFSELNEVAQIQIKRVCNESPKLKLFSFFIDGDKREHLRKLRDAEFYPDISAPNSLIHMFSAYAKDGFAGLCLDYFIDVVKHSTSYSTLKQRMQYYILDFLPKMSSSHYKKIFSLFDECTWLKGNFNKTYYANKIWKVAENVCGEDVDKILYESFFSSLSAPQSNNDVDLDCI